MKHRTRHGEYVSHGDGHVRPAERLLDLQVVRTVFQRPGVVTADLVPDTRRPFQVVLLHDQLKQRRCQIETYQQLQEEGSGHRTDLNSDFGVPRARRVMFDEYEKRGETQARVDREVSRKQDALHFTERVSWQRKV